MIRTIRIIAGRERAEMLRDGRYRLCAGLLGGLLLLALLLGAMEYRSVRAEAERASEASWTQWVEQGEKNPHSAAHFAVYVYRPVSALTFVDPGVTPYTGVALWLEAHTQNDFSFRPAADEGGGGRLGPVAAAAVLQLLLPLIIVVLASSTFAAERERGTLRLVLAQGVSARALVVGKALGVLSALLLVLIPSVIAGAGIIAATSGSLAADGVARFAALTLAYALYSAAWTGIALGVSAIARSTRGALIGAVTCWALGTLVAPGVATDLARAAYPTVSAAEFWQAVQHDLDEGIDGHDSADARAQRLRQQTMDRYGVESLEELPINFMGVSLQAMEEHSNAVFDKHYQQLWAQLQRQNRLHMLAGAATPLMAVRSTSMGLAGTDLAAHLHFAKAAERHRRSLIAAMNTELTHLTDPVYDRNTRSREFWAAQPRFTYRAPTAGWALSGHVGGLLLLLAWAVGGFGFAVWAASRPGFTERFRE